MTPSRVEALATFGPRWSIGADRSWTARALDESFGRQAPRLLDVGCGDGRATTAWAAEHPDWDVVGVDLHRPGLARLVGQLGRSGPPNVRVAEADVTELVAQHLEPGSVDAVRILFPDPWPKRRHLERRLVDRAFVARLADLLPAGGGLHIATDWDDYASQAKAALDAEPRFGPWSSVRPDRPETTYERRGRAAGRPITDLVVVRT
ncbi:MAG: tRNA ((7)-)-methyltransferase [Acidimicrobiales bacterium]|nr:tRNA ((7)-)-methyltransferase [Acidimicrobiales bacterium]